MKNGLVSIILPTYNRADFIENALQSVFDQTYENWELVIIDDGSTDETVGLLEAIKDPRIIVLRQENRGVSAARNAGISQSQGEYVALLDSDDVWMPEKLAKQIQYMQNHGYEVCQTNEIWMRGGKRVNQPAKYAKPEGWFFEESVKMCLISPSCTIFTRNAWQAIGPFDETMLSCEDYDLWLRACLKYPVGLVKESLTVKHGGRKDQLSICIPCADKYRIQALVKALEMEGLTDEQREVVVRELETKGRIYCQGCEKRKKSEEANSVWNLICKLCFGKNVPLD